MRIVEHSGVVRTVIDAINAAYMDGDVPTVRAIVLTQAEMEEFMERHPFVGGVGKMYGDADVASLMHVKNDAAGKVTSFFLYGIEVMAGNE